MQNMLDSFDHVVVVMLENRSFDNILGHLYPDGVPSNAPLGKTFNGVTGKDLSNPIPKADQPGAGGKTSIPVGTTTDYHQPFPDPGETYPHVNTQLFNQPCPGDQGDKNPPYNLPPAPLPTANMQGFVADYIENLTYHETKNPPQTPTYDQYAPIMDCFDPAAIPVLSTLATEFAVFDQWYCSVPSQTWCNRAFWHAGTSWGHVVNGASSETNDELENTLGWIEDSVGTTIFNQIEDSDSDLTWKIYTDDYIPLTGIIHFRALAGHMSHIKNVYNDFLDDCRDGNLPSYSFVEPKFIFEHNDMHPSSFDAALVDGKEKTVGSVLRGEQFVWDIYNAIRTSNSKTGSNWQNTLLIITFDEHGGCYDHVAPPTDATPPDLDGYKLWMDFKYDRLGIRVPMIMVSANIAKNTVVNDRMDHNSFMNTMADKWDAIAPGKFPPLTARVAASPKFHSVFTSPDKRPPQDWPDIPRPVILADAADFDFADTPLHDLQRSIVGGAMALSGDSQDLKDKLDNMTVGSGQTVLKNVRGMMDLKKIPF